MEKSSRNIASFILVVVGIVYAWIISVWMNSHYLGGDLSKYRTFWDSVSYISFTEVGALQKRILSSGEPIYGLLIYLGSKIFGREAFFVLGNVAFVTSIVLCLRKFEYPARLFPLIFTNYYFFVLIGPAERLKFSFLFFALALFATGWKRFAFMVLAPLTHFQTAVMVGLTVVESNYQSLVSSSTRSKTIAKTLFLMALFAALSYVFLSRFGDLLQTKINSYSQTERMVGFLPSVGALILGVALLERKVSVAIVLGTLTILAAMIGGSRVNIMTILFLFAFFVREQKFYHPALLALQLYFCFKSVAFIQQIELTGVGFGS